MKVAMITPRYPPNIKGGGEISCKLLVDTLRGKGLDVDVISGDVLFPNVKNKEILNLKVYQYLKKRRYDYDIFHTYNMSLLPCLGLLTKKYNINSVATLNGIVYSPTLGSNVAKHRKTTYHLNKIILDSSIKHIKKFTTLSEYFKNKWVEDGIPINKISVITNMISKKYVSTDEKIHSNFTRLLFIGNYAKWRNLESLLDAYIKLPQMNVVLNIVGEGWNKTLENYWDKYCFNKIKYYGKIPHEDVMKLIQNIDIYIQPYSCSGIGRVMLEVAQNDTSIISTGESEDYPYLHEGIVFTSSDRMSNTLESLIKHQRFRKWLSARLRTQVKKYFSPDFISEKYIKIYEGLKYD